jgi:hypothetical protein
LRVMTMALSGAASGGGPDWLDNPRMNPDYARALRA